MFAGIQPFQHQFDTYKLVQTAAAAGVSGGLFASSWTYQQQSDDDPFEQREQQFWIGLPPSYPKLKASIGSVISERATPGRLPFLTNFGGGTGRAFYIEGRQVSPVGAAIVHWSNLSNQDVLPTYRYWISSGSATAFEASLCQDLADDGGSSLLFAQGAGAQAGESSIFTLFSTDFEIPAVCTLSVTLAAYQDLPVPAFAIILADSVGQQIVQNINISEIQGSAWFGFSFDLSAQVDFVVTSIQAQCTVPERATSPTAILLGELKLMDIAATGKQPQAVQGLAAQNPSFVLSGFGAMIGSFDLIWDPPTDDTFTYNIYQAVTTTEGTVNYTFLGRAFTNAWRIDDFVFGASNQATLAVQPRNIYGYEQTLDQATTVIVQWSSRI